MRKVDASRAAFLLALPVLLIGLARNPVSRSQEARVVLGAQAMVGKPMSQWLIPQLNGNDRFQKPPLATWLAAISFSVFGVNEFAGRLPNALAGWLTIAIVYAWARSVAGNSAGIMAAIGLFGSHFFIRFTRLAETDAAAMPWVTLAFFSIWSVVRKDHDGSSNSGKRIVVRYHLAALGAALACMAKGGPGAFPLIYLVALAVSNRSSLPLKRFVTTGAIATFAVVATPWFLYVWQNPAARTVLSYESAVMIRGGSHTAPFYEYFVWIAYGCLPWTGFGILGLTLATLRARHDRTSRDLLLAVLSVLVPLLLLGQKQPHYLMSLLPILFVVSAVELHRLITDDSASRSIRWMFHGTSLIVALAAIALATAGAFRGGGSSVWLMSFAGCVLLAILAAEIRLRLHGVRHGLAILGVTAPLALIGTIGFYWPTVSNTPSARAFAADVNRQFGSSQLGWWGKNGSLAVTFYLHRVVPSYDQSAQTPVPPPPPGVVLLDLDPIDEIDGAPRGYSEVLNRVNGDECLRAFAVTTAEPQGPTAR